jgi:hypothetical protein
MGIGYVFCILNEKQPMRLIRGIPIAIAILLLPLLTMAQADSARPLKVAVFAPLYIDSSFNGDSYKLGNRNPPRYALPGLDFYNGVMMAVDSLNADHAEIEVLFYDSKSVQASPQALGTDPYFTDISLIIGAFNTRAEIKPLADLALQQHIPLLSVTYPSDGGITANPYFVMLNPGLPVHIESIYKYLQRNYPIENITVFRRKANAGTTIQYLLNDMNRKTAGVPLKLQPVELTDGFTTAQLVPWLDSTRQNIIVCGALDEAFGMNISGALASLKNFPVTLIGMPTWDGLRDMGRGLDIIYSTPYNLVRSDKFIQYLDNKYRNIYAGRPTDMFFKGFESMYHFSRLLIKYPQNLIEHLSDTDNKIFADFDIQPVRSGKDSNQIDYLENKKIYFIRKQAGKIKSVTDR